MFDYCQEVCGQQGRRVTMENIFKTIFAVAATVVSAAFGIHTKLIGILVFFMAVDYISGLIVAGVFNKSGKTETGAIESAVSIKGLFRKIYMLFMVCVAVQMDSLLGIEYIALAVIYFFIANESISILENAGLMGIPLPPALVGAIEVLKKKSTE